jgi:uncharacterized membrane protein
MGKIYYRLSVVAGVMSGILFSIVLSLPYSITVEVLTQLGNIFVTLWLVSIYLYQRDSLRGLGKAGFFALVAGGLYILLQNFLVFYVWKFDYPTIEAQMDTPIWFLLMTAGPVFVWAIMALGTASLEVGKLPRGSTILWFVGWLLFMILPSYATLTAAIAGVIWSGFTMWKGRDPIVDKEEGIEGTEKPEEVENQTAIERGSRLYPLDAVRGLILALMAIDHSSLLVRKVHTSEFFDMPMPAYENTAAFLTRFVSHICAPGFFFLMGAGMVLLTRSRRDRGWSYWQIARHFLVRGLSLIVLEQLLLDPVLYDRIIWKEYGVLFGLGGAMIAGILFLRLGSLPLLGIGTGLILITQVTPTAMINLGINYPPLVRLFLVPGYTGDWFTIYPILPWLGIAALGMAFGREILKDRKRAYRATLIAGSIALVLFVLVRSLDGFGNFQSPAGDGWIDYLNMVKYPPSLAFTLLTVGIILLLIYLTARLGERLAKWGQPLLVFGGTALFFYFMQWFLLNQFNQLFPGGTNLAVMYACWVLLLVLLYPICRGYMVFKRGTSPESVWRLF